MTAVSNRDLLEMRDELIRILDGEPGFKSVGIGRDGDNPVLVVSINAAEFHQRSPRVLHGVGVHFRDLGRPVAQ